MKIGKFTKNAALLFVMVSVLLALVGCTGNEADRVNANLSKEADNFNISRRIVVMNMRTDTVLMELVGTFSISNNSKNELVVTCELPDGTYKKNYIYLNEWTAYIVEDLKGTSVSKYAYELNILPEMAMTYRLTFND